MEHNKVLMVIVSVAFFLAALVGVGVVLLYPRTDEGEQVAAGTSVQEFDPIEYVRRQETAPLEESDPEEPVIVVYGDEEDDTEPEGEPVTVVETDQDSQGRAGTGDGQNGDRQETSAADSDVTETSTGSMAASEKRSEPAPAASAVATARPERAPARSERVAPPSEEPAQPETREVRVTEYWIQLIASPSRDRVEQARVKLADYSLGGRITSREVDDTLFFRLRVGPYTSSEEAQKFLSWIQDIPEFEGAYISEEYPLRTVSR